VYSRFSQIYSVPFSLGTIDSANALLLTSGGSNFCPDWQPHGDLIAYDFGWAPFRIAIMRSDGSSASVVPHTGMGDWRMPDWSPTGRICHIRYPVDAGGTSELFIMDSDGSRAIRLTNNTHEERTPRFSPDGSTIAFSSRAPMGWEVWLVAADGSERHKFANGTSPTWSPDGLWIAFVGPGSGKAGYSTIWKKNLSSGELVQLTFGPE
jgi:Tol biopolymer transport system component